VASRLVKGGRPILSVLTGAVTGSVTTRSLTCWSRRVTELQKNTCLCTQITPTGRPLYYLEDIGFEPFFAGRTAPNPAAGCKSRTLRGL
jgi:hypothetical protein